MPIKLTIDENPEAVSKIGFLFGEQVMILSQLIMIEIGCISYQAMIFPM